MEVKTRAPEPLARRGHHRDMVGVVTRVRLRRCRDLVVAWKQYREIERMARRIPGFRHSAFLLQGPRTFAMVSLWDSQLAIDHFETDRFDHAPGRGGRRNSQVGIGSRCADGRQRRRRCLCRHLPRRCGAGLALLARFHGYDDGGSDAAFCLACLGAGWVGSGAPFRADATDSPGLGALIRARKGCVPVGCGSRVWIDHTKHISELLAPTYLGPSDWTTGNRGAQLCLLRARPEHSRSARPQAAKRRSRVGYLVPASFRVR